MSERDHSAFFGATVSSHRELVPGRLWSLWDMLIAYGHLFTSTMDQIEQIHALAQRDPSGTWKTNIATGSMVEISLKTFISTVQFLAKALKMKSVADQARRVDQMCNMLNFPLSQIAPACWEISARLKDELTSQHFLAVPDEDMVELYRKPDPFELGEKFKEAHADIQDAAKCLALGMGTASVMHMMRAMEAVVQKLSRRLKMTVTHKTTWRILTGGMDGKIKNLPDSTPAQKKRKSNWEEARVNLHHVGSVWRNNTMHPAEFYTQRQAQDVFDACRVFKSRLAVL